MTAEGVAHRGPPTPDEVAAATVRVGEPVLVAGVVHWLASSRDGRGDMALFCEGAGAPQLLTGPGVSLRSRLFGYGADAWCATAVGPVGVDAASQALGRLVEGRVEPQHAGARGAAIGDPAAIGATSWVVAVEADDEGCALIAVDVSSGRRVTLAAIDGLAAEPRPSPDGRVLAWVRWPHGRMPWDAAELWVAGLELDATPSLRAPRRLDGGPGASAGQPTWQPGGRLAYVTEAAGYWQPWVCDEGGAVRRLCERRAEFQRPRWTTCRWLAALGTDGALGCAFADGDGEHVGVLAPDGRLAVLEQPCVRVDGVAADADRLAWVGATTSVQGAVLAATEDGQVTPVVLAEAPGDAPTPQRRRARHDGVDLDVVLWPPTAPGPVPAPLVVQVHPGPTGAVDRSYSGAVHLLCARGFAVAAVDTSGSTAHGRRHRERLEGRFGALDVDEVAAVARALAADGLADARASFVRGTSAGGTTALLALSTSAFVGAVAWYPASDLADEGGAGFEAGYLATLTGPDPAARSPLANVARLRGAVLLVQGADDPIVPARATQALCEALRTAGVEAEAVLVAGEGHGFRTRVGRARALAAELGFYERLAAHLGVTGPAGGPRYDASTPPAEGGTG